MEESQNEKNNNSSDYDNQEDEDNNDKDRVVEQSPKERFLRFNEELGFGAYKTVYRGYDRDSGCEVAWNVLKLQRLPPNERKRILEEITLLKNLHHPNIISFVNAWINKGKNEIVFITECLSGGSLKQHLKKIGKPKLKIIKNWCRQILSGLVYLHQQKPYSIIHRDIKCENIFINTTNNEIRIGDLGLAISLKNSSHTSSVIGTPEFMAPEIYEEKYGTPVDIYSFGMCVLEMATLQKPYKECTSAAQIYRKVSQGVLPSQIDDIQNEKLKQLILKCLNHYSDRPTAEELLNDSYLCSQDQEEDKYPTTTQSKGFKYRIFLK
ncbi:mitogen activated protein kinase family protein, putative [Ichthyophthirius multifiliis]|uniref:Mitogen activated protein kinase family protein, putative n=1 Tax=Ichthyophthirius multifiliis TaxID=5932 RepID=G0R606_ICHMU|nr:mitogen activated protein kinase family protein, putative [Ichthyophthirius multifiliis]EGR27072.1 mitogen activated protein kinase family protein, putative [Ichthyophthirius multifiliis]|eukprot:XP_004023956.1 mitogen activated protein kinase family protein, putative [Ichthyophthirius multifiliis]